MYLYHSIIRCFPLSATTKQVVNMESLEDLQDVIRCDLCETPVPSRHCDICHNHLCEECEREHISDESKEHVIVSFRMRGSTPKCSIHPDEICTRHCKKCNSPICALCVSLGKHKRHKSMHISKIADDEKKTRKNDLQTTLKLQCNTLICAPCVSSDTDKHHKTEEPSKMSEGKRGPRKNDFHTKITLSEETKHCIIMLCFIFFCLLTLYLISSLACIFLYLVQKSIGCPLLLSHFSFF